MAIETEMVPTDYNAIFEEREPEIFRPEIKRPEGDYFNSEDLISFLNSSPAGLVEILRRYQHTIKIYCILSNDRKFFYDESIDPMDCLYILSDAKFHYLEVRRLYDEIIKERIVLNSSAMKEAASLIGDAAPLVAEAAILSIDKEALQKEIASLKAELAALKSELTAAKELNASPVCDGRGLPVEEGRGEEDVEVGRQLVELKKKLAAITASMGKLKKDLKNWQAALPLAVKATANVLATEEKTKSRKELSPFVCAAADCKSRCETPEMPCAMFSKEQFNAWRIALPPEHVNQADKSDKEGRATYPPNTVETVEGEQDTAES